MQAFVRLSTEFDNLLLNAAGYFDVSPYIDLMFIAAVERMQQLPCHKMTAVFQITFSECIQASAQYDDILPDTIL